ncbi:bacteriocin [Staphylococcus haemolyticus]|uniref:bacteriocin n=1 Tax=Staphylococcus haemolyticus TaxID=1283 RepID=UPI00114DF5D6|nr:bacteriocin [Staphylococcus haemolyticus]
MKTLNITELKKINGGEVNDARRNGEKTGNFARETKNLLKILAKLFHHLNKVTKYN